MIICASALPQVPTVAERFKPQGRLLHALMKPFKPRVSNKMAKPLTFLKRTTLGCWGPKRMRLFLGVKMRQLILARLVCFA